MTVRMFNDLGKTRAGQSRQINRAFSGLADELERRRAANIEDAPMTAAQYERRIADLEQKLADAEALISEMRAYANGDEPAAVKPTTYWDSKRVARESHVAVCTICRNADKLGGTKLGGDWVFPVGTTYGKQRRRK